MTSRYLTKKKLPNGASFNEWELVTRMDFQNDFKTMFKRITSVCQQMGSTNENISEASPNFLWFIFISHQKIWPQVANNNKRELTTPQKNNDFKTMSE